MPYFLGAPKVQFFDSNGDPLSFGKVHIFEPGTSSPKDSYPTIADAIAGTNANANPVILDSRGEAVIVVNGQIKVQVTDSSDVDIWSESTIDAIGGGVLDSDILDSNDNEILTFSSTTSAINYITATNAATGNAPVLSTGGSDAAPGLNVDTKGSGAMTLGSQDAPVVIDADTIDLQTGGSSRADLNDSGLRLGGANARVTTVLDEDDMSSDSATALATQQSINAYSTRILRTWYYVTYSGGIPTLQDSYNVSSIVDSGVGILTIVTDKDSTLADHPAGVAGSHASTPINFTSTVSPITVINTMNADPDSVRGVVYG